MESGPLQIGTRDLIDAQKKRRENVLQLLGMIGWGCKVLREKGATVRSVGDTSLC